MFRTIPLLLAGAAACFLGLPEGMAAVNIGQMIRRLAEAADEVPINKVDDVAQDLARSRAGRELVDQSGKHADDVARSRALTRLLRETLEETGDRRLVTAAAQLDEPAQEAMLILGRGSQALRQGIPDLAIRSRFLRDGGAETVAALGRYGDLTPDALRFDMAVRAGRLPSPPGSRAITLEDFGRFFREGGRRSHHFWVTQVRPHWKVWVGSAALAAVLLAPDEYLDAVGNLTKEGFEKLGRFTGRELTAILTGTLTGAGEGTKELVRETAASTARTFFSDVWGGIALAVLLAAALLFVRPIRRRLLARLVARASPATADSKTR